MKKLKISAMAIAMAGLFPALAAAATGFATANVNLRAGPSTQYPPVTVIPAGARLDIRGCMRSANWCDVNYRGISGWVSASYLQTTYNSRRVYVGPQYYAPLGIPNVTFSIGSYWDRHYRGRDFYRDRDRWDRRDDRRDGVRVPSRDDDRRTTSGFWRNGTWHCPPGERNCVAPPRR